MSVDPWKTVVEEEYYRSKSIDTQLIERQFGEIDWQRVNSILADHDGKWVSLYHLKEDAPVYASLAFLVTRDNVKEVKAAIEHMMKGNRVESLEYLIKQNHRVHSGIALSYYVERSNLEMVRYLLYHHDISDIEIMTAARILFHKEHPHTRDAEIGELLLKQTNNRGNAIINPFIIGGTVEIWMMILNSSVGMYDVVMQDRSGIGAVKKLITCYVVVNAFYNVLSQYGAGELVFPFASDATGEMLLAASGDESMLEKLAGTQAVHSYSLWKHLVSNGASITYRENKSKPTALAKGLMMWGVQNISLVTPTSDRLSLYLLDKARAVDIVDAVLEEYTKHDTAGDRHDRVMYTIDYLISNDRRTLKLESVAYQKLHKGLLDKDLKLAQHLERAMNQVNTVKKLSPFMFMIDGYFSVAEEVVAIYENSKQFTLTEYKGRDEFYSKYYGYYKMLLEEVLTCDLGPSQDTKKCLGKLTDFMLEQIQNHRATLSMFMYAYYAVLSCVDVCRKKNKGSSSDYHKLVDCSKGFEAIKQKMLTVESSNLVRVPMITPKGVYGINTFLYMYFRGLFPIGVTTDPINVHGIEVGDSSISYMIHDLTHYKLISGKREDNQKTEYPIYQYILQNQKEIGVEKCKGLLFIIFFHIHENIGPGLNESIRMAKLYWYDWWHFIITNGHYTPKRFGITFPTTFRGEKPLDITRHDSKWFEIAMVNDKTFHDNVYKLVVEFVIATYNDYTEIKNALGV